VTQFANHVWKVEKKLGLRRFTKITPTGSSEYCIVQPAAWWYLFSVRHSFLTIMLRAARYQGRGDLNDMLRSQEYFRDSWRAVERFMSGKTKYDGRLYRGWADTFNASYFYESSTVGRRVMRLVPPGRKAA
jgi:hypothetical protein